MCLGRGSRATGLAVAFEGLSHFAIGLGLFQSFAFVVQLFAAGDGDRELDLPLLEIDGEGDEGQALEVGLFGELAEFAAMQQEFPFPTRFVVEQAGLWEGGNVAVDEPEFVVADTGIGFVERNLPSADAFDLAPQQHDPALEFVKNLVIEPGLAVLADGTVVFVPLAARRFGHE